MDLVQEKLFRELMEKYKFDIAVFKQQQGGFESKLEQLETLSFYHFNRRLTDSLNEYIINNQHKDPRELYSSAVSLLFVVAGDILKLVDKKDKTYADKVLEDSLKRLNETRGDTANDRFT